MSSVSKLVERHCGTDTTCQQCGAEIENTNHILFECPPAFQFWILSPIPTPPGLFPCTSLYANFEYLLQQVATAERENGFSMFPWLIWYVWKARNEKCFNAKDISPLDTLQLAQQEAETLKVAQLGDEVTEEGEPSIQRHQSLPPSHTRTDRRYTCQVDGSWAASDEWMGMGFVILEAEEEILQGQICTHRAQSPIHAEAEDIIWAMKEYKVKGA